MQIDSSSSSSYDDGSAPAQSIIVWVDDQAFHGLSGHTLGREDTESITVDHKQVSRRHAQLDFGGAGWSIKDLGSTNGLHDETGRHEVVALPPGRTQVWLGPPDTSPCLYFDVTMPVAGVGRPSEQVVVPSVPTPDPLPLSVEPPTPVPETPSYQQPVLPADPSGQYPAVSSQPSSMPPPPASHTSYTPPQHQREAQSAPQSIPAPPSLNSVGLESNIGQLSQVIQVQQSSLLIGRASDCDLSIPDPLVSRQHARLILHGGSGRIVDLGSDNGTFVNGQRVTDSPVTDGDLIEMGKAQFVLSGGVLQQHVAHGLPLQADNLSVTVSGGLQVLSDVSFTLPAGSMTAVIGPSGCGKSTLLNALTGRRPANEGRVLLGGRDLYSSDEGLGRRIGFVPQDDPVHPTLSVRHALTAAARLRLPADTTKAEIGDNVEQVASELGLSERLATRVQALSGGQRKRVSVGYELVGEPQALILDEPTSGLDPGLERDLMTTLRQLADKGTTTVVVTHSVQSVEMCDLVLVLAPGGRLAFIGPPSKVARHFNCGDLASVFNLLGTRQRAEWELEFARTTSYLKFGAPAPPTALVPSIPLPPRSFFHDLRVMLVRYSRALLGDRRRMLLLLLQAPLLGLLLSMVLFRDAYDAGFNEGARPYVLATVLAMTWLGGSNTVREIVQDRDVFRREMAVGVSAIAFVLSRWLVLGALTVVQAVVLHLVASSRQRGSLGSGVLLASGQVELMLALAGIGLASVGIGLLISAAVSDTSKALTILPLVIIPTLLLSGLVIPTSGRAGVQELTYLNPVQWGGSAAAVTIDLQRASGCDGPNARTGQGFLAQACSNQLWDRTTDTQALNLAMLGGWSMLLLILSGFAAKWTLSRPLRRG